MGDSNTPINSGVSVHHHTEASSQGGALVLSGSDPTKVQVGASGKFFPLGAFLA